MSEETVEEFYTCPKACHFCGRKRNTKKVMAGTFGAAGLRPCTDETIVSYICRGCNITQSRWTQRTMHLLRAARAGSIPYQSLTYRY